jgi:hypothetical protein
VEGGREGGKKEGREREVLVWYRWTRGIPPLSSPPMWNGKKWKQSVPWHKEIKASKTSQAATAGHHHLVTLPPSTLCAK